ncbi:Predicted transglutaminase-like cysteine proteinase [Rhodoblastus acidophilus]|uniref:Predicted transglutaminase-like cysteine proteinase n=1 Tax=Rhodoblastus acidophilus TaxID=1074 RepID=A0A212RAG8_RHOAC|nr:transglutaminase-like cysteine peptidase [Rhodoblastus acidophilus]MCW2317433.1 putative transglutaminase-like cysteine proteinase [Rhodoblastus acidophilus]SNB69173.1 Predicted transglutaminase-like cysteine proteinase [Rhodoblastus acidophilus]
MRIAAFTTMGLVLALAAAPFIASDVGAKASVSSGVEVAYASVGADTSIPFGWVEFCQRYASECAVSGKVADVNLTEASMHEIRQVNTFVNRSVEAVSDMEHWGVVDRWDLPADGKGDCEDYALMKRKMLIERGYPRSALLVTVVRDQQNEGHAILTVKTNGGEYVLDNLTDEVKPVSKIAYRFVKRQSQQDPNVWVALGPVAAQKFASR